MSARPNVAFVVIAIGELYLSEYNAQFKASHELYCQRNGYDFKVLTAPLNAGVVHKDTYSFNKILVAGEPWAAAYDWIIVCDADIFINPQSPALHTIMEAGDAEGRVGIVDEFSQNPATQPARYYRDTGFRIGANHILNTGLIVFKPATMGGRLVDIWNKYIGRAIGHKRGYHYEQSCVGYELLMAGVVYLLPQQFNALWIWGDKSKTLEQYFEGNYFVHFAGSYDLMSVRRLHKYLK